MPNSNKSEWQAATQLVPCEIKPKTKDGVDGFLVKRGDDITWHENTPEFNQEYFGKLAEFDMDESLKATYNFKNMGSVDEVLAYYHFESQAQVSNASKRTSVEMAQRCFPFMFLQCLDLSVSAGVDPQEIPVAQRLVWKAETKEGQKVY